MRQTISFCPSREGHNKGERCGHPLHEVVASRLGESFSEFFSYQIQRATTLHGPWTTLATETAPIHGIIE